MWRKVCSVSALCLCICEPQWRCGCICLRTSVLRMHDCLSAQPATCSPSAAGDSPTGNSLESPADSAAGQVDGGRRCSGRQDRASQEPPSEIVSAQQEGSESLGTDDSSSEEAYSDVEDPHSEGEDTGSGGSRRKGAEGEDSSSEDSGSGGSDSEAADNKEGAVGRRAKNPGSTTGETDPGALSSNMCSPPTRDAPISLAAHMLIWYAERHRVCRQTWTTSDAYTCGP